MAEGICHFGGCFACRCPLLPGTDKLRASDSYAVCVVNGWFKDMTARSRLSAFTGPMQMSHVVSRAHIPDALELWLKWTDVDGRGRFKLDQDLRGWNAADFEAIVDGFYFHSDPARWDTVDVESGNVAEYKAAWKAPAALVMSPLIRWIKAVANPSFVAFDAGLVYPCCMPCNLLMDMKPRLRDMLRSDSTGPPDLVPYKCIRVFKMRRRAGPAPMEVYPSDDKNKDKAVVGCLVAYYLHRCLRGVLIPPLVRPAAKDKFAMYFYVLQCWFTLVVTAALLERIAPLNLGDTPRGDHNFLGVAQLYIGHTMYLMLRYEHGPDAMGFSRFYAFYFLEMQHCTEWWDAKTHKTMVDFVAQDLSLQNTRTMAVVHVAERLVQLYTEFVHPAALHMMGRVPVPRGVTPDRWALIKAFFVGKQQGTLLLARHNECQLFIDRPDQQDIAPFFRYFGGRAILGPCKATMLRERKEQRDVLDRWIDFHVDQEAARISQAAQDLDEDEALAIHRLQHLLRKDKFLADNGFEDDSDAVKRSVAVSLKRVYNSEPHCSRWKAVTRLLQWGFAAGDAPSGVDNFLNPPAMPGV